MFVEGAFKKDVARTPSEELSELQVVYDYLNINAGLSEKEKARRKREQARLRARQEKERRARLLEEAERHKEMLQEWLSGSLVRPYYSVTDYADDPILNQNYMVVRGQDVVTSLGAVVSVEHALMLYMALKAKRDIVGQHVGPYTVTSYDGTTLVVGCHTFRQPHINEVGESLLRLRKESAA